MNFSARYANPSKWLTHRHLDTSFVIARSVTLRIGARDYDLFSKQQDACTKVVLKPFT